MWGLIFFVEVGMSEWWVGGVGVRGVCVWGGRVRF